MLWFYRLFFVPTLLLLLPFYLRRMWRRGGYGENFGQRFGAHPLLPAKRPGVRRVWLQAVSVGEMLAVAPLLEALQREGVEVYLTTTTSTGYRLACERYRALTIGVAYFPVDWWPFSVRAWRAIEPDLAILTEGERWPEHMRQAVRRGVPVLAINARISDRSFRRMKRFAPAAHLMVDDLARLLPCSDHDAARFRELGVPAEKISVTGNIKLDVSIPRLTIEEGIQLRRELGLGEGLVLLGSSTWPGEEEALLGALQQARECGLNCRLLLVPRHAERRADLERILESTPHRFHFRSQGAAEGLVDVAVGDTTGELRKFTQLADLVFVGKSLPPHTEGQTPVEAATLERAMLFGPGMGNFRELAADLRSRGAALQVRDAAALQTTVVELLRDADRRRTLASSAGQWRRENSGAVARTLAVIRELLSGRN